jgi:phage terminase small subunit
MVIRMAERKLTGKQRRFVEEYAANPNGSAAARAAGYSPKVVGEVGCENLQKSNITSALDVIRRPIAERLGIDAEYVTRGFIEVAERSLQRKPVMVRQGKDFVQATDENGEGVWTFDAGGACRSLENLGKTLPDFYAAERMTLTIDTIYTYIDKFCVVVNAAIDAGYVGQTLKDEIERGVGEVLGGAK